MADKSFSPHVLIVDNEPGATESLKHLLACGTDYHVHTACDSLQAMAALRRHPVDVIITDVALPAVEGESRRGDADCTATVIMTGNMAVDDITDVAGSFDDIHYIDKPWDNDAILTLIRAVADRSGFLHEPACGSAGVRDEYIEKIFRFAAATDVFDDYTYVHVLRIGLISRKLAKLSGEDETYCQDIKYASMMHDVGKIGIPRSILKKRGSLDPDELDIMKTHAEIGAEILGIPDNRIIAMARDIAMCHHENWDGSGYPRGLRGDGIPKSARIVAIADMFDALLSERPYKPRYMPEKCRRIFESEAGVKCDPGLLLYLFEHFDGFLEVYRELELKSRDELAGFLFRPPSEDAIYL